MQLEEYALRLNAGDFASRSKANAKPQRRDSARSSKRTFPIGKRTWTGVEPGKQSFNDHLVSKKLIHVLRHGSQLRDNDGAIEFWRIKIIFRTFFVYSQHWSDEKWKSTMARGGGKKKRFHYCTDSSGTILYLRSLQGHSGRNLINPSLQDNVLILDGFFKYIYHAGCAINLHSIINSGLIPGGQNLNNRLTVFFLLVDPMDKTHKDPETIDLDEPRHAQYMHETWKKHQNTVYWIDVKLAQKKGLKFYQTRSNATILYIILPAYCIPKVVRMENGEIIYEKVFESRRLLPKISLRHDWMKELGSEVARQADVNQPTQPNPNPDHDRTVRPFVIGQPIGSSTPFDEVDIDFRVSGLPHAVVKQAENFRVRELVKRIENHPHRQALQADLQQNNAYNPFSEKSKKMIKDMCNVELLELCETIPKVQCKECLLCWNQGIVYCTCGRLLRESIQPRYPPMDIGSSLNPELCH